MKFIISTILITLMSTLMWAQDELIVITINQKPFIEHTIVNNQSIFVLSKTYHLSLAEIADNNNALYKKGFKNGDKVLIPVNELNYITQPTADSRPLYYIVDNNETLTILSKRLHIIPSMLQTWNDLPTPQLKNGQKIIIGWIKYANVTRYRPSQTQGNIWQNKDINDEAIDAATTEEPKGFGATYENLENTEQQVNGLAVFYNNKALNAESPVYAFHNILPRGSIIKLSNPLDAQLHIYAQIIGVIPNLPQYNKAIVVLSDNAKFHLKPESEPFFCNLYYK